MLFRSLSVLLDFLEQSIIAENAKDALLEEVKKNAKLAYEEANNIELAACNPIKLGLALNYSVFNYEVLKDHAKACELADNAL